MNTELTRSLIGRLDGAVWVLLLTALAYSLAYGYQCGYLAFFGVPAEFVEVDLRAVLICAAISIAGLGFLVWIVGVLLSLRSERMSERLKRDYSFVIVFAVVVATFLYLLDAPWPVLLLILAGFAGMPVLNLLIYPVFEYRNVKGYLAKLEKAAEVRAAEIAAKKQEPLSMSKYISPKTIVICLCVVLSPFLAYFIGHHAASHQTVFLVSKDKSCLVVSSRADGLLCASFESQSDPSRPARRVRCEYAFLETKSSVLQRRTVGPLEGAEATQPNVLYLVKVLLVRDQAKRKKSFEEYLKRKASGGCSEDATAPNAGSGTQSAPMPSGPVGSKSDAH